MVSALIETEEVEANATKILVAEDDKDIRELIFFTLRLAGYDVWTASDGVEAIELAQEILPDLILMDVRMPRMTGYAACEIIKQKESLQDIPIVFLSAKGQEAEIQQGIDVGAEAYILKPFAPVELMSQVKELLSAAGRE
ncbi:MAG: response regulator [Anaerolineae bacterium]|nr:MAG: response regulator [Anaerolineae bacterium]